MRISWVSMPGAPLFRAWEMFEDEMDGTAFYIPEDDMGSLMMVSKAKTAPDIYGEREMTGPEWDEPKDIEVAALYRTGAVHEILANDPKIKGWKVVDTMWTGRAKRNADRSIKQLKGRAVLACCEETYTSATTLWTKISPLPRSCATPRCPASTLCLPSTGGTIGRTTFPQPILKGFRRSLCLC